MKLWHERLVLNEPLIDLRPPGQWEERAADVKRQKQLREQYERGFIEGQSALREEIMEERAKFQQLQSGVLATLRQAVGQVRADCESGLVELALEVARKIAADLPVSREMIEAAIHQALAEVEEAGDVTVLLNPEDFEMLGRNSPLDSSSNGDKTRFKTSHEVTRGGCIVQTRFGVVDARRETKFQALKHSLQA
jgi:flagellar assembly protein FliH